MYGKFDFIFRSDLQVIILILQVYYTIEIKYAMGIHNIGLL